MVSEQVPILRQISGNDDDKVQVKGVSGVTRGGGVERVEVQARSWREDWEGGFCRRLPGARVLGRLCGSGASIFLDLRTQPLTIDPRQLTRRRHYAIVAPLPNDTTTPLASDTPTDTRTPQSAAAMFALSEESKERIAKLIDVSRVAIHYGYLPLILYLGMPPPAARRTRPRPKTIILCVQASLTHPQATPAATRDPPSSGATPKLAERAPPSGLVGLPPKKVADVTPSPPPSPSPQLPGRSQPAHPYPNNHPPSSHVTGAAQALPSKPPFMPDPSHAGLSPAAVESVAGLSAGTIATLVVHPLDIVKTRMQIYRSGTSSSPRPTTVALLRSLTANDRPLASLYRGLTPNLVGNASSWASFFFFKSRLERALAAARARPGGQPTAGDYFVSSALAGVATSALTNPVWVLKTRMLSSDRAAAGAYPSMLAGARQILRTEGPRGFYRGLGVSMLGVSHGAVQFAVYEPAKRVYFKRRQQRREARGQDALGDAEARRLTTEATVVLSSVAKLVAGAATYPYQVLRSRLQNYQADERFGRGFVGVVSRTWAEEGLAGFYRGLVPGVVRVMPATWVTFLVYENVKYYLPRWLD
ncbi:hypothetical protein Purlil1_9445 [Purpureocillium lilacinum]|uniref:Mitochondrial folate carrier protein Flx1 n=2 Tax=Purpureocillium lilacinum TaxID=33203 RepID=A0ABR0BRR2_PURLI|nr:hypothetical protein Purlil1_9445 [Purpureocillium lilacinum]